MSLTQEKKHSIMNAFQRSAKDTGSPEVQIALLTESIQNISEHLKTHPKDFHCRRGLLQQVNSRRSLLAYLKKTKPSVYQDVIARLGLRR